MPGTFSQIYIQIVFAVKGRENLIANSWKTELHKYIAGTIRGKGQKPIIVNGMLTTDQDTWLLVGDPEWINYSLEFRTDSKNGFFWEGYNAVGIHVLDIDNMYAYKWAEYESASYIIENGNWNEVPQSEFDPSNEIKNFRLTIKNNLITIYENGEKRTSYYDSRFEKGRIVIKIFAETVFDDFIVREIFE